MKNYFSIRNEEHIKLQLEGMKQLINFFRTECGVYAYLTYGSLLGAVRNQDVIGHDTDYDIAYMSKFSEPKDIHAEWREICCKLIDNNMLGKIWTKQGIFIHPTKDQLGDFSGQMHVQTPNRVIHIDVYTSFCKNGKYHLSFGIHGHLKRSDIVPFGKVTLRGIDFPAPKRPEAILKFMYGKDWMTPKEAYKYQGKRKKLWEYK